VCRYAENGLDIEKFLYTISELLPWLEGARFYFIVYYFFSVWRCWSSHLSCEKSVFCWNSHLCPAI